MIRRTVRWIAFSVLPLGLLVALIFTVVSTGPIAEGQVIPTPTPIPPNFVSLTKTASPSTSFPGGIVDFTVTITLGSPKTNVTMVDDFLHGIDLVSGSVKINGAPSPDPTFVQRIGDLEGGRVTYRFELGSLPAGVTIITFQGKVDPRKQCGGNEQVNNEVDLFFNGQFADVAIVNIPVTCITPTATPTATPTTTSTTTPTPTSTPGVETPTATSTPGEETPTPTSTPGVETPTATSVPGEETPTPTSTPGVETPTATSVPGEETPTPTSTPGVETPTATSVPGEETPTPTPTQTTLAGGGGAEETPIPSPTATPTVPPEAVAGAEEAPSPEVVETPSPEAVAGAAVAPAVLPRAGGGPMAAVFLFGGLVLFAFGWISRRLGR